MGKQFTLFTNNETVSERKAENMESIMEAIKAEQQEYLGENDAAEAPKPETLGPNFLFFAVYCLGMQGLHKQSGCKTCCLSNCQTALVLKKRLKNIIYPE